MDPSTGACISPMTSSSVKSTAATGVLKAAASAADAPIGTSALTLLGPRPSQRPKTDAMPAPTCTDGPSRPSEMPLARETEESPNFPSTVRSRIKPSCRNSAALVCGMPLPRAFGKYLYSSTPVISEPRNGIVRRRQGAPPAGYMRAPRFSVTRMKEAMTRPTMAPITRVKTRRTLSSYCRR